MFANGATAWFTTGIQELSGPCTRLSFSQIWSGVIPCGLMQSDAVISHTDAHLLSLTRNENSTQPTIR